MGSGAVIWFTGLPQSGKSTLAGRVREELGGRCILLDSDEVRAALGLESYAAEDRDAFYRALGGLGGLLSRQGHVVLVAATAPRRAHRELARAAAPRFVEVWVQASLAECEARDGKGLYARARAGEAPMLPGIGAAYEPPEDPAVIANGGHDTTAMLAIARLARALPERRS